MKNCIDATDWCEISAGVKHSESLEAFMSECKHEIEVVREVVRIDKNTKGNHCMTDICVSEIHPALADVPSELWSRHKYDVGLIKNCEPVVITPKSDYRPCQHKYPLKREAVLGINPVFDSLLKEGIIVECSDSPVRTPIFPVKKIRDKRSTQRVAFCAGFASSKCSCQTKGSISSKSVYGFVTNTTRCNILFSGRFG